MPILGGLKSNRTESPPEPSSPSTPPTAARRKSALSSRTKDVGTKESGASSVSGRSSASISFEEPDADNDEEEDTPSQPRDREGFSSKDSGGSSLRRSFSRFSGLKALGFSSEASQDSGDVGGERSQKSTKETTGSSGSGSSTKERPIFGRSKSSINAGSRKSVRVRKSSKMHGSGSRSSTRSRSRSRSSGTGESWSSSSSEDLADQDLSEIDQSILPLHMREGAIVQSRASTKLSRTSTLSNNQTPNNVMSIVSLPVEEGLQEEEDEDEDFVWVDNRSDMKKFLSYLLGYEPEEKEKTHILFRRSLIAMLCGPFLCWAFIALAFLGYWVWRCWSPTGVLYDALKINAMAAIVSVETDFNNMLSPAYTVAHSIAFGARAGLLNTSDPLKMLERLVEPEMLTAPALRSVRVVGAAKQVALMRPGDLHSSTAEERLPRIFTLSEMCLPSEPVACLALDHPELLPIAASGASVRWQRPTWISVDEHGAPLDMSKWVLGYRLAAKVDAFGQASHSPLAFEITVALRSLQNVKNFWDDWESDVSAFVCLKDGTLLTSDSWHAKATLDSHTRTAVYLSLWDLDLPWASVVTKEMLLKQGESEGFHGEDIVMIRPLLGGVEEAASYRLGAADLRIVVYVPKYGRVSAHMRRLVGTALISVTAPAVLICCACFGCCTKKISFCIIRQIFFRIE